MINAECSYRSLEKRWHICSTLYSLKYKVLTQIFSSFFRWVKFEEDVEEGGNRWSKPHVATLSLHSLFELRSMLLNGTVCLDMTASSLDHIAELVLGKEIKYSFSFAKE